MTDDDKFAAFWEINASTVKACPFCGTYKLVLERKKSPYKKNTLIYFIKCRKCYASCGATEDIEVLFEKWQQRKRGER